MKNHLFLFLFMAGQRVQIKAPRHCWASVTRFTRHWGTSPLTALVIHCKGYRGVNPLPSAPTHSPNCPPLELDTRGADVMNEKGQKDQQGRTGHLGWLEWVGEA